jgi:hypothetical protein
VEDEVDSSRAVPKTLQELAVQVAVAVAVNTAQTQAQQVLQDKVIKAVAVATVAVAVAVLEAQDPLHLVQVAEPLEVLEQVRIQLGCQ